MSELAEKGCIVVVDDEEMVLTSINSFSESGDDISSGYVHLSGRGSSVRAQQ